MKLNEDTFRASRVLWRGKPYDTGNRKDQQVELYRDGKFVRVVSMRSTKSIK